ncbi:MAG: hypothetical protein CMB80_14960 [Flammeovirgaceae bacterium]|nr:hypothetical protein [Flammeovirgaceae bacterium]MBE63550.1 hypothetical protein [Flammeovirgaceae bacterium]HCX24243.1 hypothetical protein [Cytophagales bacterium]|tara:strand:- start:4870 stop:6105 length:1236 start_codon:yes stop_codon:yes gene_type:complete
MKKLTISLSIICMVLSSYAQDTSINYTKIQEDLDEILTDIAGNYVYLQDKNIDLNCIREYYASQIASIKTEEETVLFFEYLLDEFYDSHLILNTNRNSSYRLWSPIYVSLDDQKLVVSSVWYDQLDGFDQNIVGAEVLKFNQVDFNSTIDQFPTHCQDKNAPLIREWVANKVLAGRYSEPRILTLKTTKGNTVEIDLDKLAYKQHSELLTYNKEDGIGYIQINNSLGTNNLIGAFDTALDELMDTKGLIIDLRNTVDGGNSYVARGIMGRFLSEPKPYQKHSFIELYDGGPEVERSWMEYVSPRGEQYTKPVVVLVGRWTGSMGEGLAIGFEGIGRATIVGSEMERLAGEMNGFGFKHQWYGYRLSTAKLYHVNGSPREEYIPSNYGVQSDPDKDAVKALGQKVLRKEMKK